jgi:hypothetical protein
MWERWCSLNAPVCLLRVGREASRVAAPRGAPRLQQRLYPRSMAPSEASAGGSAKNSTALRDLAVLLLVYALWEVAARLQRRALLKAHPKKRGVPLAQPLRRPA